jgi:glutathionylspermidine amidase/synthetase
MGLKDIGHDSASNVFTDLVATWKSLNVTGTLHLLCDQDNEEVYHTLYMKKAAEAAGISCKMVRGIDSLSWNADGDIQDADNQAIRTVHPFSSDLVDV